MWPASLVPARSRSTENCDQKVRNRGPVHHGKIPAGGHSGESRRAAICFEPGHAREFIRSNVSSPSEFLTRNPVGSGTIEPIATAGSAPTAIGFRVMHPNLSHDRPVELGLAPRFRIPWPTPRFRAVFQELGSRAYNLAMFSIASSVWARICLPPLPNAALIIQCLAGTTMSY